MDMKTRPQRERSRKKRWVFRLLTLQLALIFSLGLAEVVACFIDDGEVIMYELHPVYLHKIRPNVNKRHILTGPNGNKTIISKYNQFGFRGEETKQDKGQTIRVMVYGDSNITAKFTEHEKTFTEQLERELESPNRDLEVLNAGVLGYRAPNGLRQLMVQILDLDPDVITVRFAFNDHLPSRRPEQRLGEPASGIARTLFYKFSHWRLMHLAIRAYRRTPRFHPRPLSVPRTNPERFERELHRFVKVAERNDIRLLFIDYPIRPIERGESPGAKDLRFLGVKNLEELHRDHDRYLGILKRVARETGTPLLVTSEACAADGGRCFGDFDLVHPNRTGVRLIAELLYRELQSLGWL